MTEGPCPTCGGGGLSKERELERPFDYKPCPDCQPAADDVVRVEPCSANDGRWTIWLDQYPVSTVMTEARAKMDADAIRAAIEEEGIKWAAIGSGEGYKAGLDRAAEIAETCKDTRLSEGHRGRDMARIIADAIRAEKEKSCDSNKL